MRYSLENSGRTSVPYWVEWSAMIRASRVTRLWCIDLPSGSPLNIELKTFFALSFVVLVLCPCNVHSISFTFVTLYIYSISFPDVIAYIALIRILLLAFSSIVFFYCMYRVDLLFHTTFFYFRFFLRSFIGWALRPYGGEYLLQNIFLKSVPWFHLKTHE